jgi:AcrR family transcriptional regulator
MGSLAEFQQRHDFSMETLCARILDRHADTVRIKKPQVAVPNLVRIVEATLAIANRKGFHSMSLRDLAEQSGLSMGALYAYFDGKETLLLMVLGQVAAAVEEALCAPPPEVAADPRERLRWLLETHVSARRCTPGSSSPTWKPRPFPGKGATSRCAANSRPRR